MTHWQSEALADAQRMLDDLADDIAELLRDEAFYTNNEVTTGSLDEKCYTYLHERVDNSYTMQALEPHDAVQIMLELSAFVETDRGLYEDGNPINEQNNRAICIYSNLVSRLFRIGLSDVFSIVSGPDSDEESIHAVIKFVKDQLQLR